MRLTVLGSAGSFPGPESACSAYHVEADGFRLLIDFTPHGVTAAEVHDTGTGRLPGIIALPHAKRRLRIDDQERMAVLARRFPGHRMTLLDDGAVLRFPEGTSELPTGARIIDLDGRVSLVGAP